MVIFLEDYLRRAHSLRAQRAATRARLLCANSRAVLSRFGHDSDAVIDLDRLERPVDPIADADFMRELYGEATLA